MTETRQERKFVRYEIEGVKDISDIWTFVMKHADEFKSLNVEINSVLGYWDSFGEVIMSPDEELQPTVRYVAAVFGDIEGGF